MYRDLGFIEVGGKHARRESDKGGERYLRLSRLPPQADRGLRARQRQLLSEYCVEFPDLGGAGGRHRLPSSDDVLAKWMALTSDEDRVIRRANMHLIGRQHDPAHPARPLAPRGSGAAGGLELEHKAGDGNGSQTPSAGVTADLRSRSRVLLDGPGNRGARPAEGRGLRRRGSAASHRGRGQHLDRDHALQLPPAPPRRAGEGGVRAAGATPMEFNTVAISDGITMGTEGMRSSLVSREVIADSIELVARGHMFDALIHVLGLRQDDSRLRDGPRPALRRARPDALRRLDRPRALAGQGRDHPGGLRGHWRARRRPVGR